MRLHPFFSFFGSKFLAAPHYPVPRHPHIVEPFAGSACYALYYPQRQVTLIESDPVIAGVWRYLLTVSEAEILSLPDLQPGQRVSELAVAPEARSLIGYWLAKAQATPRQTPSAWMHRHPDSSFWGRRVRERIARQLGAIRHWQLIEGDYAEAGTLGPATYFVDPPYEVGGRQYRRRIKDHAAVGAFCRALPGQVLVCEAAGATWLPFRPLRSVRSFCRTRGVDHSHEVLWESEQEQLHLALLGAA